MTAFEMQQMDLCNNQLAAIEQKLLSLSMHPFLQGRDGLMTEIRSVAGVVALLQVRVALMSEQK